MRNSKQIVSFYETAARNKVSAPAGTLVLSGIFSGAFIAFGAFGSQIANASVGDPGLGRMLGAVVFPVGLTMVLCVGTELFTGNSLLFLPLLQKKIDAREYCGTGGLSTSATSSAPCSSQCSSRLPAWRISSAEPSARP